jgi:hypothetical protein
MSSYATERPPATYARQEHETGFTAILGRMLSATPGAIGAALVDAEGEAVDYCGDTIDPFEIKVAAAHWQIVIQAIDRGVVGQRGGATRRLVVETTRRIFVIDALPDGYALLSILLRGAAVGHADRAVDVALRDLYREAGWAAPPELLRWHAVEVRVEGDRPVALRTAGEWNQVSVIGKVAQGLRRDETGYRVGVDRAGCELTLVFGRDDRWYADVPPDSIRTR